MVGRRSHLSAVAGCRSSRRSRCSLPVALLAGRLATRETLRMSPTAAVRDSAVETREVGPVRRALAIGHRGSLGLARCRSARSSCPGTIGSASRGDVGACCWSAPPRWPARCWSPGSSTAPLGCGESRRGRPAGSRSPTCAASRGGSPPSSSRSRWRWRSGPSRAASTSAIVDGRRPTQLACRLERRPRRDRRPRATAIAAVSAVPGVERRHRARDRRRAGAHRRRRGPRARRRCPGSRPACGCCPPAARGTAYDPGRRGTARWPTSTEPDTVAISSDAGFETGARASATGSRSGSATGR